MHIKRDCVARAGAPQAAQLLQFEPLLRRQIIDDGEVASLVHLTAAKFQIQIVELSQRKVAERYKPCTDQFL
jgi:hypothetical protein